METLYDRLLKRAENLINDDDIPMGKENAVHSKWNLFSSPKGFSLMIILVQSIVLALICLIVPFERQRHIWDMFMNLFFQ